MELPISLSILFLLGFITCAMRSDDRVVCWGWNADGQLGIGSTNNVGKTPDSLGINMIPADLGAGAECKL